LRWTRRTIVEEIKRLHKANTELNYASAEAHHLNLVRAAAWHFGTWRRAVEAAGIDYERLSKYQRWDQQRIIERILQLHQQGADLSWRAVSLEVDPPLAAAALRPNGFPSWRAAITAAGLDISDVARYQYWDDARIIAEIQLLHRKGEPLSSKAVQISNQPLFCAARRRFESWDNALNKAGFSAAKIRLRRPATAAQRKSKPNSIAHPGSNGTLKPTSGTKRVKGTAPLNGTATAKGASSTLLAPASKTDRTRKIATTSKPSRTLRTNSAPLITTSPKLSTNAKATPKPHEETRNARTSSVAQQSRPTTARGTKPAASSKAHSRAKPKARVPVLSHTSPSRTR